MLFKALFTNYQTLSVARPTFSLPIGDDFADIIRDLKSSNWYTQNPAIERFFKMDFSKLTLDQLFIVGRNIYQCADGGERRAIEIVENLRREMTAFPLQAAEHLINGMFYEVYFNSEGEFRGIDIKGRFLDELFEIQPVKKYEECISFIRRALKPYSQNLAVLPCQEPETFKLDITIKKQDPPLITSVKYKVKELIVDFSEDDIAHEKLWKLSFKKFTFDGLKEEISGEWHIPINQIEIICDESMPEETAYKFLDNKIVQPPFKY